MINSVKTRVSNKFPEVGVEADNLMKSEFDMIVRESEDLKMKKSSGRLTVELEAERDEAQDVCELDEEALNDAMAIIKGFGAKNKKPTKRQIGVLTAIGLIEMPQTLKFAKLEDAVMKGEAVNIARMTIPAEMFEDAALNVI